mgnify:FL=1
MRADMMRTWRTAMQLTQKELAELLSVSETHISLQECSHLEVADRTLHQVALLYSIHSLPPDAPVSILQEMLIPPSLAAKREKARERLARRQAARTKTSKRSRRKR